MKRLDALVLLVMMSLVWKPALAQTRLPAGHRDPPLRAGVRTMNIGLLTPRRISEPRSASTLAIGTRATILAARASWTRRVVRVTIGPSLTLLERVRDLRTASRTVRAGCSLEIAVRL